MNYNKKLKKAQGLQANKMSNLGLNLAIDAKVSDFALLTLTCLVFLAPNPDENQRVELRQIAKILGFEKLKINESVEYDSSYAKRIKTALTELERANLISLARDEICHAHAYTYTLSPVFNDFSNGFTELLNIDNLQYLRGKRDIRAYLFALKWKNPKILSQTLKTDDVLKFLGFNQKTKPSVIKEALLLSFSVIKQFGLTVTFDIQKYGKFSFQALYIKPKKVRNKTIKRAKRRKAIRRSIRIFKFNVKLKQQALEDQEREVIEYVRRMSFKYHGKPPIYAKSGQVFEFDCDLGVRVNGKTVGLNEACKVFKHLETMKRVA